MAGLLAFAGLVGWQLAAGAPVAVASSDPSATAKPDTTSSADPSPTQTATATPNSGAGTTAKPKPTASSPTNPKPPATVAKPKPATDKVKNKNKHKADKKKTPTVPQSHTWAEQGLDRRGIKGIDVSHWQHPADQPVDWKAVRKAGVRWAYVKCSDGSGLGDYSRWGPTDVAAAQAVGIPAGCYHYAQPGLTSADPVADALAQADSAIATLPTGPAGPQLPLALDMEETRNLPNDQLAVWAVTFLDRVASRTATTPWLYASSSYLLEHLAGETRLHPYPVWVAAYGLKGSTPPPVPLWAQPVAWQFSSQGKLPGIASDNVDLDVFHRGRPLPTRDRMSAAAAAAQAAAAPPPACPNPAPEQPARVYIDQPTCLAILL